LVRQSRQDVKGLPQTDAAPAETGAASAQAGTASGAASATATPTELAEAGIADELDRHHQLARRAAAAGAVLLKNESALLPLAAGTRVAVIGCFAEKPRYQGAGSSGVNPRKLENVLGVIDQSGLLMTDYAPGFRRDGRPDSALKQQAVTAARDAEVVLLYLGLDEAAETEGADRADLALPPVQVELLEALAEVNRKIVVILSLGGALEMPWLDHCQALLHGYLAGEAGASGIIDLLTGVVNPSGRLAETFPLRLADHPTAEIFPSAGRTAEYREGLYVGYRYFTTADRDVAFPFGFGLSYTEFSYSDLTVDADQVRVRITNSGQVEGAEIVQLYVHRVSPGAYRPTRELKGFARVEVRPGESAEAVIPLSSDDFRYFSVETGRWEVEAGLYELQVGSSSKDIRLVAPIEIAGTVSAQALDSQLPSYASGQVESVSDQEFERLLGRPRPVEERSATITHMHVLNDMHAARSWLARRVHRVLARRLKRVQEERSAGAELLFVLYLPFGRLGKMTGGVVDRAMADSLLDVVNGHFWRGLTGCLRGYIKNRRANRSTAKRLEQSQRQAMEL
jgi:beta-glucosidase